MKLPARIVAWVLPLFLSGCFHAQEPEASALRSRPVSATFKRAASYRSRRLR